LGDIGAKYHPGQWYYFLFLFILVTKHGTEKCPSALDFGCGVWIGIINPILFILPLIIFGIFALKNKQADLKQILVWSIILLATFAITFLPIVLFYFHDFLRVNPFIIQTERLLPLVYVPAFIIIAVMAGYYSRNKTEVIFASGIILFSVFIVYFVHTGILHGFHEAYFNSIIDLSYALFSLPFLLFALSDKLA